MILSKFLLLENSQLSKSQLSWFLGLSGLAFFCVCLMVAYVYGPLFTSDGRRDIAFADILIKADFNPFRYIAAATEVLQQFDMRAPVLPYVVYIYVLAFCKLIAGASWLQLLVFINATCFGIVGVVTLSIVQAMSRYFVTTLAILILMILAFDALQWIAMSQSTPVFMAVVILVFRFALNGWTSNQKSESTKFWLLAILLAIFCIIVRPASPPIIATVIFGWVAYVSVKNCNSMEITKRYRISLTFLAGLIFLGILLHAYLIHDPTVFAEGFIRDSLKYFRETQAQGWIIWARPETYVPPPESVEDFVRATLTRGAYFFWFLAQDFSMQHKVLNVLSFVPLYALSAVGIWALIFDIDLSEKVKASACLSVILILMVAAFVAITYLDYGWRYRAPVLPAFLILAAIGIEHVLKRIGPALHNASHE